MWGVGRASRLEINVSLLLDGKVDSWVERVFVACGRDLTIESQKSGLVLVCA